MTTANTWVRGFGSLNKTNFEYLGVGSIQKKARMALDSLFRYRLSIHTEQSLTIVQLRRDGGDSIQTKLDKYFTSVWSKRVHHRHVGRSKGSVTSKFKMPQCLQQRPRDRTDECDTRRRIYSICESANRQTPILISVMVEAYQEDTHR